MNENEKRKILMSQGNRDTWGGGGREALVDSVDRAEELDQDPMKP